MDYIGTLPVSRNYSRRFSQCRTAKHGKVAGEKWTNKYRRCLAIAKEKDQRISLHYSFHLALTYMLLSILRTTFSHRMTSWEKFMERQLSFLIFIKYHVIYFKNNSFVYQIKYDKIWNSEKWYLGALQVHFPLRQLVIDHGAFKIIPFISQVLWECLALVPKNVAWLVHDMCGSSKKSVIA